MDVIRLRQGVFFYNDTTDLAYGDSVPSFMMDMLTGPYSYIPGVSFIDVNGNNIYENGIDTPLDTAVNYLRSNWYNNFTRVQKILISTQHYYLSKLYRGILILILKFKQEIIC